MKSEISQKDSKETKGTRILSAAIVVISAVVLSLLITGTLRSDDFWQTKEQLGDALMKAGDFGEAADTFTDPARIGLAQYRDGQFENAAKTFSRVPGAVGAFNQGNAWLMNGKYNEAVASYDRALESQPVWLEAVENRSLALTRQAVLDKSAEERTEKGTEVGADEIVFDQKKKPAKGEPQELSEGGQVSDAELQALWLRQVTTTPADFLRVKFAYQAATKKPLSEPEESNTSTEGAR